MDSLADALSRVLDRRVVDKTEIAGVFNFHLTFARGESMAGSGPTAIPLPTTEPTDTPSVPSIFTVLENLGLKVETTKAPRGYVVVDHVERPSEN